MGRWNGKSCRLSTMMGLTAGFFLVEIIVGYLTNSIALVADSFHMLSDLAALIVGLASVKIAKKSSKGNTFGWQRAEVLGALINCVFLMAMCFSIVVESLKRIVELEPIENPLMMLAVGGLGLLVNLLGLALFGCHGHAHGGSNGHSHGGSHGHSHGVVGNGHVHSHGNGHVEKSKGDLHSNGAVLKAPSRKIVTNGDSVETKCLVDHENGSVIPTIITNGASHCSDSNHSNNDSVYINNNNRKNINDNRDLGGDEEKEVYSIGDDISIEIEKNVSSSSMNMRGVFLHVLGDALGSVVVVISGLAIWLLEADWKYYLDPVLSFTIVIIILYTTIPLFKETAHILLQAVPQGVCVDGIRKDLMEIEGVTGVIECHIWQLSGRRNIASAHVRCSNPQDYSSVLSKVKDVFNKAGIYSTTIQPEFEKRLSDASIEQGGDKSCENNRPPTT